MFAANSRYAGLPVQTDVDATGRERAWVTLRIPPATGATIGYLVRAGDRVDTLAQRAYGDPSTWWRIADANPDDVSEGPDGLVEYVAMRIELPQPVLPEVMP